MESQNIKVELIRDSPSENAKESNNSIKKRSLGIKRKRIMPRKINGKRKNNLSSKRGLTQLNGSCDLAGSSDKIQCQFCTMELSVDLDSFEGLKKALQLFYSHMFKHNYIYKCPKCNLVFASAFQEKAHLVQDHNVKTFSEVQKIFHGGLNHCYLILAKKMTIFHNDGGSVDDEMDTIVHAVQETCAEKQSLTEAAMQWIPLSRMARKGYSIINRDLGNIECIKCGWRSNSEKTMQDHEKDHIAYDMQTKCQFCSYTNYESTDLADIQCPMRQHLESKHPGSLFYCPSCRYISTNEKILHKHVQDSHNYHSSEELSSDIQPSFMAEHAEMLWDNISLKPFHCRIPGCGMEFTGKSSLLDHLSHANHADLGAVSFEKQCLENTNFTYSFVTASTPLQENEWLFGNVKVACLPINFGNLEVYKFQQDKINIMTPCTVEVETNGTIEGDELV